MQLKVQRSQRTGGLTGKTVFFALDVRADYSRPEQDNINKYKLGKEVIYNSAASKKHLDKADAHNDGTVTGYAKGFVSLAMAKMNLNITIDGLGSGQHVECKDLSELLEAEETVLLACKNVKQFLDTAATFDGRTVLIDFDEGEMIAHQSRGVPDLARHAPTMLPAPALAAPASTVLEQSGPVSTPEAVPRPAEYAPMQTMRSEPANDFVPLLDRLTEQQKAMLIKVGIGAGVVLVLYLLIHAL
jgi:hypothetical protein